MSRTSRRIGRAIRITPAAERERYASEWLGDAQAASTLGIPASEVAQGASRVAWRLRLRHTQSVLAGAEGPGRALGGWVAIAAVVLLGVLGPLTVPLVLLGPLVVLFGSRWRTGTLIMGCCYAVWILCTVAFWWLWGVGFDASDAGRPVPQGMVWSGPSFFFGLAAFVTFWTTFVVGAARRPRPTVLHESAASSDPQLR